jgi:hypothetical protein
MAVRPGRGCTETRRRAERRSSVRRARRFALVCGLVGAAGVAAVAASGKVEPIGAPQHRVTISNSGAVVDGRPTLLLGVGWISPESVPRALGLKMNTFISRRPGRSEVELSSFVGRRGFVVPDFTARWLTAVRRLPNRIGYLFEDEPDGRDVVPAELPATRGAAQTGSPIFLTLTPKFLNGLPKPPGISAADYAAYVARADVILTDPYPLAHGCADASVASLSIVYDSVVGLAELVHGSRKAVGEWIETGPIEGYCGPAPVAPPVARAEAWAAVAGGAKAILWFTHSWTRGYEDEFDVSADMGNAIRTTNEELSRFAPILLSPRAREIGSSADDPVKVGLYRFGGRAFLVAVNLSEKTVTLSLDAAASQWMSRLPGLQGQPLSELLSGRVLTAAGNGSFDDTIEPFAPRVYAWTPRTA